MGGFLSSRNFETTVHGIFNRGSNAIVEAQPKAAHGRFLGNKAAAGTGFWAKRLAIMGFGPIDRCDMHIFTRQDKPPFPNLLGIG
ncbi:MAG: hypothetical protein ACK52S_05710 [Pirellula sp.]